MGDSKGFGGTQNIAIGFAALNSQKSARAADLIAIGTDAMSKNTDGQSASSISIGGGSSEDATNTLESVVIGQFASRHATRIYGSVVIGANAVEDAAEIALGNVIIGSLTKTYDAAQQCVIIGGKAEVHASGGMALGYKFTVEAGAAGGIAIGGTVKHNNSVIFGTSGWSAQSANNDTTEDNQFIIRTRNLDIARDVTNGIEYGLILTSPNNTRYRVTVDNSGTLQVNTWP